MSDTHQRRSLWVSAQLVDLIEPRRVRRNPAEAGDVPYIGMEDVEAHTMRLLGTVPAHSMKSSAATFEKGDVFYGRLRPYLNKVVRPDFTGLASSEFIVFPDTTHLRSSFLQYRLNAQDFVSFASHLNAGDRPRVDFEQIGSFKVEIPPPKEQERIVGKIDELFSDLDAGVAALERARAKLKRYRAAVLKAAVEGRLTAEWRKANPAAEPADKLLERILTERRKKWEDAQLVKFAAAGKIPPKDWKDKYPEPAKLDTDDLFDLPQGWTWATLDGLTVIVGGLTKGQKRRPHEKTRPVPYLRVANVQRGYLDLSEMKTIEATEAEVAELNLKPGDVLFNEGGDRDKLGRGWVWAGEIEECVHQNHVFRARPIADDIQSKFISFHGNTFGKYWFLKHGKQSVNLASINMTVLRQFPVPLPPKIEQVEIVKEAEDRLSVIDKATAELEIGLRRAAVLRQAILKRAFEGKLVPQDPSDEPASVLLERIRAARAAHNPPRAQKRRRAPA